VVVNPPNVLPDVKPLEDEPAVVNPVVIVLDPAEVNPALDPDDTPEPITVEDPLEDPPADDSLEEPEVADPPLCPGQVHGQNQFDSNA